MAQNKTDLVMQFVLNKHPVRAECDLDVDPTDGMMTEFAKSTAYDNYSNFFEVSSFNMTISLKEGDQSTSALNPQGRQTAHQAKTPAAGAFARWRSATAQEATKILYPLEFDKFTFERVIDAASPIFFDCCCKSTTFDKAVLVKRISQGELAGVVRPAVGYLRIEFTTVLIIAVNWDDGDVVKEHCDFICQQMKIRYRQQNVQGSIGAEMPADWPTDRSRWVLGNAGGTNGRG